MTILSFEIGANVSTAYLILQRVVAVLKWWVRRCETFVVVLV